MIEAVPRTGAAQAEVAGRSLAHAAEDMIRASGDASLHWRGTTLGTLFQPIYSVKRGLSLGFEAFAEAVDADGRMTPAGSFFEGATAEERALLDWACRALHLRNYATVDPGDRTLFLNVHPEAVVRDVRRARQFAELIRYYGLAPKRVCIEIVSALCSDEGALGEAVAAYRDLGVSIAIDDFGMGGADFARVEALRPDIVKVDGRLLKSCGTRADVARHLEPMVERLRRMHARVAVEGLESHEHVLGAIDARADYLQGFFLAAPHRRLDNHVNGAAVLEQLVHSRTIPA